MAERLLESFSEFLSGVKLYLSDDGTADESLRAQTKAAFEAELRKLHAALAERSAALLRQMQVCVCACVCVCVVLRDS
eukprot:COSAG01_NODE_10738_length_2092_cov_1.097842_4_plen_78_part_00